MVASFTDLLERKYGDTLGDEGQEFIRFANDGAKRMKKMLEDILTLSRVNAGPVDTANADPAEALERALSNLKIAIEESGAEVRHDEFPRVKIDPARLTQLLQNLVGNAIKFRSDAPPRIEVGAIAEGTMCHFTVSDNGIGMDPTHCKRIFEVFRRLHTREKYQGSGIGLSICKRIVEKQGGDIWVETKPSEGSRFHFTLPLA